MGGIKASLRGELVSEQDHARLVYLDVNHDLQPIGAMVIGTAGDLRIHLQEQHQWPEHLREDLNKRKLARLHMILHATMRLEEL